MSIRCLFGWHTYRELGPWRGTSAVMRCIWCGRRKEQKS